MAHIQKADRVCEHQAHDRNRQPGWSSLNQLFELGGSITVVALGILRTKFSPVPIYGPTSRAEAPRANFEQLRVEVHYRGHMQHIENRWLEATFG